MKDPLDLANAARTSLNFVKKTREEILEKVKETR